MSGVPAPNPDGPPCNEGYIEEDDEDVPPGGEDGARARASTINTTYIIQFQETVALAPIGVPSWVSDTVYQYM